jgi:hypothetical protein
MADDVAAKLADFRRNPSYERKLVAFCDVLGWRSQIERAGSDPVKIGELRRLILQLTRTLKVSSPHDIQVSSFSDNIVMSQAIEDPMKMMFFLQQLGPFIAATAIGGFLLRGGITIGDIHHDEEVVFGPALNRAYHLESKVADYPRVILDQEVFKIFPQLPSLIVREDQQFLDPFRKDQMEFIMSLHRETPKPEIAAAGLPVFSGSIKGTPGDVPLRMALNALKPQIRSSLPDEHYRKVAWLYDRIAAQLGVPLSNSYPRVRPSDA